MAGTTRQGIAALLATAVISACASGPKGSAIPSLPYAQSARGLSSDATAPLNVVIAIPLKGKRAGLTPRYVSVGTHSILVKLVPATGTSVQQTFNVTAATNPDCAKSRTATTCTLKFNVAPGRYTGIFLAYSGFLNLKGRPGGQQLEANFAVPITVKPDGSTVKISTLLEAVPASVALVPAAGSMLSGDTASGFTLPKCAAPQTVRVLGIDAAGYYILGAGSPKASLVSSDSTTLQVASHPANTFVLTRHIAVATTDASLTASVTPPAASGARKRTHAIPITLAGGSTICGVFTEYPLPLASSHPSGIALGQDGALWFLDCSHNEVGRITTTGAISEYPIPTASSGPNEITSGPDGALWFTEYYANKIGRITTSGVPTEYSNGLTASAGLYGITAGPDNALWFTELNATNIGRITTTGAVSEYPATMSPYFTGPSDIVTGPDGDLWYTEFSTGQVARMTTGGSILNEFSVTGSPYGIAVGSDGNLWFGNAEDTIGQITTTGTVTHFPVPTASSRPYAIAAGPDGELWFDESEGNKIGRMTTAGAVTEFTVPTASSRPGSLVTGPDGALWFVELDANQIGRLQ